MRRRPQSRMWGSTTRWSSCIYTYVSRDTAGCELQGRELENRFPATPFVSLNWFLEGAVTLQPSAPGESPRLLPTQSIIGKRGPTVTVNCGDIRYFGVAMYPDAFAAVFGIALAEVEGRFVEFPEVLEGEALAMCDAVANAVSHEERCRIFEAFLAQRAADFHVSLWTSALRAGTQLSVNLLSRMLALGRRQTIRTTKNSLGVGVVDLKRFARGSVAFDALGERIANDQKVSLSDIAATAGYADQAHLSREAKNVTGRTPGAFLREFETEEGDWVYRASLKRSDEDEGAR